MILIGSCLIVGVVGLILGGGLGVDFCYVGLICDVFKLVMVVLFGGDVVSVFVDDYVELFWVFCGGGGGNFGVMILMMFVRFFIVDCDVVCVDFVLFVVV